MVRMLRRLNWVVLGMELLLCIGGLFGPLIVFGHGLA